jgi:hypothetical protein
MQTNRTQTNTRPTSPGSFSRNGYDDRWDGDGYDASGSYGSDDGDMADEVQPIENSKFGPVMKEQVLAKWSQGEYMLCMLFNDENSHKSLISIKFRSYDRHNPGPAKEAAENGTFHFREPGYG